MRTLRGTPFHWRMQERRFNRACHFLIGIILFVLVVGMVVSQARAQGAPAPGISQPANSAMAPASAQAADGDDIRDIHGPISIPYPWMWMVYTAGGIALAAMLYALWRWYYRKQERIKLPHELALEALEKARPLMRTDSARAYCIAVSEAVRHYIEVRFDAHATHRTTEEFLHGLVSKSHSPLATHSPLLEQFLTYCDLVKFARHALTVPEMESIHSSAEKFILATRPVPETTGTIKNAPQTQFA